MALALADFRRAPCRDRLSNANPRVKYLCWSVFRCMTFDSPARPHQLQQLKSVREGLLNLHQVLLFSERAEYEQYHGQIQSSGEFFRLVLDHDWFSWLRPMSQLIVQIDEQLDNADPLTTGQVEALLREARNLLRPNAEGTTPEKRYFAAIQRDPRIALMHSEVAERLVVDRAINP
jgi:hypothetical protein